MKDLKEQMKRLVDPTFHLTQEYRDLLAYLRDNDPVCWMDPWPDRGVWAVTRHEDIKSVYERPEYFSNEVAGNIIPADPNFHKTDRDKQGFGLMIANTDVPRHKDMRAVFSRYFSGPQVLKHEEACQAIVDNILDDVAKMPVFDFVMDAATHLPARLICQILGVPEEDWPLVTKYVNSFACYTDPEFQLGSSPAETFRIAMDWTFDYVAGLIEKRRVDPGDDLCSIVVNSTIAGEPLTDLEAVWGCWAILAGGFETSRNVIAGGLLALIQNPSEMQKLRDDPKLMQPAIDEMLRWTTPGSVSLRVARKDAIVGGQQVRTGEWLLLFLDSANRDDRVFDDPFTFDITRKPNRYLSFGAGVHNCIGRMLVLLETRVMLASVLERTTDIEIAGPLEFTASTVAKGVKRMPVRVTWKEDAKSTSDAELV